MESRYTWKNQLLLGLRNFAVLGGIILILVYLLVVSGEAAKQELEELLVEEQATITHIDEPVVYGYENGAKTWELRSEVAEEENETDSSELDRIYELILFKGGEENLVIRADHGVWEGEPREELTLTGNVVVESGDETTLLLTEILIWEEHSKTLSCPEFVDFWVEDNHIIANSLYSDDDLATIDFVGDVEMFVVGLEGENFVTREGDFPIEDIEDEEPGDGMNILAKYVHYDKGDRICDCYPDIPLSVQVKHNLDADGRPLPEDTQSQYDPFSVLTDPEYLDALQMSVSELDLDEQELAFLAGEMDQLPRDTGADTPSTPEAEDTSQLLTPATGNGPETMPDGFSGYPDPFDRHVPPGETTESGAVTLPGGLTEPVEVELGPDIDTSGGMTFELPSIPRSDPERVLSAPEYSQITEWEISPDLYAELYEGDPNFDPYAEIRDGLVFCYREDKKIWCEELHIDLAAHVIEALRHADGRFRDLKDEDSDPPETRAGRAIQESPTQFIGNYLIHNWREDVTEGYGRVLVIQPEKDIEADNVVYYEESDVIHAWGDVLVHQYGGQWWMTSGAIEDVEDERAREDVRKPTVITTDSLLSYSRRVTWAFGNVVFRQEEQVIRSERGQYEEYNEILMMAGDVDYVSDEGEQLECQLLTLDLFLDEYIAEGAAIARNIVPEEYRDNLAEFRADEEVKPEDYARARLLENRTAAGLGDWSDAIINPPPPPIELMPGADDGSETTTDDSSSIDWEIFDLSGSGEGDGLAPLPALGEEMIPEGEIFPGDVPLDLSLLPFPVGEPGPDGQVLTIEGEEPEEPSEVVEPEDGETTEEQVVNEEPDEEDEVGQIEEEPSEPGDEPAEDDPVEEDEPTEEDEPGVPEEEETPT